jgi:hypothetical protein
MGNRKFDPWDRDDSDIMTLVMSERSSQTWSDKLSCQVSSVRLYMSRQCRREERRQCP